MEPCPCNRQEQEVLPVLSQLCAQSMLNDLSSWSGGGDGVLQFQEQWANPSLEVSTNPLGSSGMSVTDTDSYSFSRHRKICLYEAKEGVVNIPFSVNGVLSPATDPVPHTMVPPSQSPL